MFEEQSVKPWWRTWDGQPAWSARLGRERPFTPLSRRAGYLTFAAGLALFVFWSGALLSGHPRNSAFAISWLVFVNTGWRVMMHGDEGGGSWMPRWMIPAAAVGVTALNVGLYLIHPVFSP